MTRTDSAIVKAHYDSTADEYDELHGNARDPEHVQALEMFWRYMRPQLSIGSVLDVGCGTGRGLAWIAQNDPEVFLTGMDPSPAMCARAAKLLPQAKITTGDGAALDFPDNSFDIVMATGVMHHVADTIPVLREMFRVARFAVVVSDHNDFAMGSQRSRKLRLALHSLGLLRPVNWIRQGFRHRRYSKVDGWYYHYSLLDDFHVFSDSAREVVILPTRIRGRMQGKNLLERQSHLCLVGLK